MKIKLYRIKTENGYQAANFLGFTKDKTKSLLDKDLLDKYSKYHDNYTIEEVEKELIPCEVGVMEFGLGDTYSPGTKEGYILNETNKYVYTVHKKEDNYPQMMTIQKHKKEHEGTQCFRTCDGFKRI